MYKMLFLYYRIHIHAIYTFSLSYVWMPCVYPDYSCVSYFILLNLCACVCVVDAQRHGKGPYKMAHHHTVYLYINVRTCARESIQRRVNAHIRRPRARADTCATCVYVCVFVCACLVFGAGHARRRKGINK